MQYRQHCARVDLLTACDWIGPDSKWYLYFSSHFLNEVKAQVLEIVKTEVFKNNWSPSHLYFHLPLQNNQSLNLMTFKAYKELDMIYAEKQTIWHWRVSFRRESQVCVFIGMPQALYLLTETINGLLRYKIAWLIPRLFKSSAVDLSSSTWLCWFFTLNTKWKRWKWLTLRWSWIKCSCKERKESYFRGII